MSGAVLLKPGCLDSFKEILDKLVVVTTHGDVAIIRKLKDGRELCCWVEYYEENDGGYSDDCVRLSYSSGSADDWFAHAIGICLGWASPLIKAGWDSTGWCEHFSEFLKFEEETQEYYIGLKEEVRRIVFNMFKEIMGIDFYAGAIHVTKQEGE